MLDISENVQGLNPLSVEPIWQPAPADTKTDEAPAQKPWDRMNLRERSQVLSEALEYMDSATEEELEIIFDLSEGVKDKLISTAYVCRKFDQAAEIILSEVTALLKQAEALKERAGMFEKRSERIKQRMKDAMTQHNIKRIETPLITLMLRKKTPKLEIDSQVDIESYYSDSPLVRIKKEFNKKEILRQLKDGKVIEGFALSKPDFNVLIKT